MGRQLIESLLDDNWTEDVTGRDEPVPKPRIVQAGERKRMNLAEGDVVYIRDGGTAEREPAGLGWKEQNSVVRVTIDIRTTNDNGGRERLEGFRPSSSPYEKEDYGGLVGETLRILDVYNTETAEYQIIEVEEVNDISEEQGFGRYRTEVTTRLKTGPKNLDPPTS